MRGEASRGPDALSRRTDVSPKDARVARAHSFGRSAEREVVRHLQKAGAIIVATNLRIGKLELDVVAREGRTVVIVEVRARGPGAWSRPFGSLVTQKRLRIRRAAQLLWRHRYRHDPTVDRIRIDAASVEIRDGKMVIEYVKAAF